MSALIDTLRSHPRARTHAMHRWGPWARAACGAAKFVKPDAPAIRKGTADSVTCLNCRQKLGLIVKPGAVRYLPGSCTLCNRHAARCAEVGRSSRRYAPLRLCGRCLERLAVGCDYAEQHDVPTDDAIATTQLGLAI